MAALTCAMVAAPLAHEAVLGARSAEHAVAIDATRLDDGIYTATSMPGGTLRYDARTGSASLVITLTGTEDRVPLVTASVLGARQSATCASARRVLTYGDDLTIALDCPNLTADDVREASSARLAAARN